MHLKFKWDTCFSDTFYESPILYKDFKEEDLIILKKEADKRIFGMEYEKRLRAFVESDSKTFEFPRDLLSYERRIVYDVAESLGLVVNKIYDGDRVGITAYKSEPKINSPKRSISDMNLSDIELKSSSSDENSPSTERRIIKRFSKKKDENLCGEKGCSLPIFFKCEVCRYCSKKYCGNHTSPPDHGCGQREINHLRNVAVIRQMSKPLCFVANWDRETRDFIKKYNSF